MDEKAKAMARGRLDDYLRARNMRRTPERFSILDVVSGMEGDFSRSDVQRVLDERSYHVSRSTLYATLDLLLDAGLLRRHRFEAGGSMFEACVAGSVTAPGSSELRLVCTRCGRVRRVKATAEVVALQRRNYRGFAPNYADVCVYGTCTRCRKHAAMADKRK